MERGIGDQNISEDKSSRNFNLYGQSKEFQSKGRTEEKMLAKSRGSDFFWSN